MRLKEHKARRAGCGTGTSFAAVKEDQAFGSSIWKANAN